PGEMLHVDVGAATSHIPPGEECTAAAVGGERRVLLNTGGRAHWDTIRRPTRRHLTRRRQVLRIDVWVRGVSAPIRPGEERSAGTIGGDKHRLLISGSGADGQAASGPASCHLPETSNALRVDVPSWGLLQPGQ